MYLIGYDIRSSSIYLDNNGKLNERASGVFASYASINFSHVAIFMFIACVIVCVVVSLLTSAPNEESLSGLTFGTLTAEQKSFNKSSYE